MMIVLTNQIARNCMVMLLLAIAAGLSLLPGYNAEAQEEELGIVGHWVVIPHRFPSLSGEAMCLMWFERDEDALTGAVSCDGFNLKSDPEVRTNEDESFSVAMRFGDLTVDFFGSVATESRNLVGEWAVNAPAIDRSWSGTFEGRPDPAGWGNLNCDNAVTSIDALLLLQAVSNLLCYQQGGLVSIEVPNPGMLGRDVNLDGKRDSADAVLILQVEAGLLERLPIR